MTNWHERPRFQPVSAFNVPSSLGFIIASLWFIVRDSCLFLSLEHSRPWLGYFVPVYSVASDSLRPHGLWPARLLCSWTFQAIILEWVAISYSKGSSWPRDRTHVSYIGTRVLYHCATWDFKCMIYSERLVTLSFTSKLWGHCWVISWPSFNVFVLQVIGTPKERESDEGPANWCNSQNIHTVIN